MGFVTTTTWRNQRICINMFCCDFGLSFIFNNHLISGNILHKGICFKGFECICEWKHFQGSKMYKCVFFVILGPCFSNTNNTNIEVCIYSCFWFPYFKSCYKVSKNSKPPSTMKDARAKTPPNYVELCALQPLLHKVA